MIKLLIIADDFTGALDTSVQFAASGMNTLVTTNVHYDFKAAKQPEVLVVDLETRHKKPDEAYQCIRQLLQHITDIPCIFKKTDSALRGNIGSELQAVAEENKTNRVHFMPAFPQMNRMTKDGVHYIEGKPVAESVFGKDPFEPVRHSYIPEIIREQSKTPVRVMAQGEFYTDAENEKEIVVYDITKEDQIKAILENLKHQGELHTIAGCAGLAAVLPEVLGLKGSKQSVPDLTGSLLVVCGSVNPITVAQLNQAEQYGFRRIRLTPEEKIEADYWKAEEGHKRLQSLIREVNCHDRVILDTNDIKACEETLSYASQKGMNLEAVRVEISKILGYLTSELIENHISHTLLLTGGDTLLGFMNHIEISEIEPICEIEVGVVLSKIEIKGKYYNVISKSGGFGTEDFLVRLMEKMKGEEKSAHEIYA